ncbi:restriction endonuclease [Thermococcus sp. MV5]|uniref:type I restriction endonuclease n=1 Tax=Thermococcus sp. MV5 TaxID=1638272 RepID=UPI00143B92CC|nr:type I restriction enzyme HsdR N-terminal domain-containing protein [Thermococcus sp. MV5]NJE25132.1 restriction endonuclease [Thermococcus sp. MV5]
MLKLQETIISVIKKVREHRLLYEKNEEAVKQHLIGEIFRTLGWDWENPREVRPEERTEEGRADYALVLEDKIVAYVEAKNLGINVLRNERVLRQLAGYCFSRGVKYGIITNGTQWKVVKAFEENSTLEDRILLRIDLLNEPLERATLKLSFLSKNKITKLEDYSLYLEAFTWGFENLKKSYPKDFLLSYLTSSIKSNFLLLDHLDGSEIPKGLYVYDNGWKGVPLIEKNLKGVLLSLLLYLAEKASKKEKNEILIAYKQLRNIPLSKDQIMLLLRELEKEKGVKIGLEI